MSDKRVIHGEYLAPVLDIRDLSIYIGKEPTINDIAVQIPAKRVTALIGPSASGKSVLLKSIVGLLREEVQANISIHLTGTIYFESKNLLELKAKELESIRKKIVYVSQYPTSFPMSIYENITFAIKYWYPYISKSEIASQVEYAFRSVNLWESVKDRLRDPPTILSAGQLQRLCLARALAIHPDIILLDEPCANIDHVATQSIEQLFRELKEKVTVFIVTHNMQQATRISDYAFFIMNGRLQEFGEANKLFTAPEKKLTQDFITGKFG